MSYARFDLVQIVHRGHWYISSQCEDLNRALIAVLLTHVVYRLLVLPHSRALRVSGGAGHDLFGRRGARVNSPVMSSFMQNEHAIGQSQHFRQFRRDQHNRQSALCQLINLRVDFLLGADIDAARRLVEKQHARIGQQPFRQHNLLLVAARQRPAIVKTELALTRRSFIERSPAADSASTLVTKRPEIRRNPASVMLLRIVWSSTRPKRFRSSVTKPMPCLMASAGLLI